jgi:hypothetical protein
MPTEALDRTVPELIDGEKPICDCCGYEAPLKYYRGPITKSTPGGEPNGSKFCEVCAGTYLSHSVSYPYTLGEHKLLWGSIGWIANRILDEIRAGRAA